MKHLEDAMQELISYQKKRVLSLAREIVPQVTADDLAQPFDFLALEQHPDFRYEEGVLEGMITLGLTVARWIKEKSTK